MLPIAAVLLSIGLGIAVGLLLGDEEIRLKPELSRAEVERRLYNDFAIPTDSGRHTPDFVACKRISVEAYRCSATFTRKAPGEAVVSGYDLTVPAHEPTATERVIQERLQRVIQERLVRDIGP